MANELLLSIIKGEGSCCTYRYLFNIQIRGIEMNGRLAEYIADRIGVTKRTVYNWNRRVKNGEFIACAKCQSSVSSSSSSLASASQDE